MELAVRTKEAKKAEIEAAEEELKTEIEKDIEVAKRASKEVQLLQKENAWIADEKE